MPAYDEEDYQQSFSWKTWKRLRPFLKPFRTAFALMVGLNALTGLVDVLLPLMQRYAIANFIEKETLRGLLPYGLVYGAVILIQSLLVVAFCRQSMKIEMHMGRDMRLALFHHLQKLVILYHRLLHANSATAKNQLLIRHL